MRNRPVYESASWTIFSGGPAATSRPPRIPAFGTEVDHPVGALDHVHVVLDDDDGVAGIGQPCQDTNQPVHVGEVQSCRGLIQDVQRLPGGPFCPTRWRA